MTAGISDFPERLSLSSVPGPVIFVLPEERTEHLERVWQLTLFASQEMHLYSISKDLSETIFQITSTALNEVTISE